MATITKSLLLALIALSCNTSWAQCSAQAASTKNKAMHFAGSFGLAFLGSALSGRPLQGFLGAVAIGGLKEGYEQSFGDGCASSADVAYNLAGSAFGALAANALGLGQIERDAKATAPTEANVEVPINALAAQQAFTDPDVQRDTNRPSGLYFLKGGGLISYQDGSASWGLKVSAKNVRLVYSASLSI